MFKTINYVIISLLSIAGIQNLFAETLEETFKKKITAESYEGISVRSMNGSITAESWDRDEVEIIAYKKVKASSSKDAHKVMENFEIIIKTSGETLEVSADFPKRSNSHNGFFSWLFSKDRVSTSVQFEIKVPRKFDAFLKSTNGEVSISNAQGVIELKTTNGNINGDNLGGSVQAKTTNGSIKIGMDKVKFDEEMQIRTTNGSIKLYLPSDIDADLEAQTTNGKISCSLPIKSVYSKSKTRLDGKINSGGPLIQLKTTNGSIKIREQ